MSSPALEHSLFYSAAAGSSASSSPKSRKRVASASEKAQMASGSSDASPRSSRGATSKSPTSKRNRSKKSGSSSIPADKFKLHFAGRVYRPLDYASPKKARKMYTTSGNWLGRPDELVDPDAPSSDEEAGSETRCICGIGPNESLMIQCEDCETWQHAACMGFESEQDCPENYFCRECAPKAGHKQSEATKSPLEGPWTSSPPAPRMYERACTPPPNKDLLTNRVDETQRTPESRLSTAKSSVKLGSVLDRDSDDDGLEVTPSSPSLRDLAQIGLGSGMGRSSIPRPPYWSPTGSPSARKSPNAAALLAKAGRATPTAGSAQATYSASRQLLAQTGNASPLVRAGPSHPLLTPTKKSRSTGDKTGPHITPAMGRPANERALDTASEGSDLDHGTVPLPEHYSALLALHAAVERALLLHLATEGSRAGALVASSEGGPSGANADGELQVDLPNLVAYTAIRAVVERGAGKRFGPLELGQLVWLWEGGLDGPRALEDVSATPIEAEGRRGGLSLSVQATRQLDKNTGKKVYTWGIGLDLRLKANVQLPAFEVLDGSPSTPARPSATDAGASESPGSASARRLKRQGMSVLPLWSSKTESRKSEMRRRLGACVARAHENFASTAASSPSKKRKTVHFGSALNDEQKPSAAASPFQPGFVLDALPPIPSATLPALGPARSSPIKRSTGAASAASGVASIDAELAAADTEKQISLSTSEKRKQLEEGATSSAAGAGPRVTPEKRQSSLMERIKAKEAERLSAAQATALEGVGGLVGGSKRAIAQSAARNSLEVASLRAKKRRHGQAARVL